MISLDDFKKQWRTLVVGFAAVIGIAVALLLAGLAVGGGVKPGAYDEIAAQPLDFVIAGTGALSGGTISVLMVQEAALGVGLATIAVFPILIAALQGLIGFPLTSVILRNEAQRLKASYRAGTLVAEPAEPTTAETTAAASTEVPLEGRLPAPLRTTAGTLFIVGVAVLVAIGVNNVTDGVLNTFVVALLIGITLRSLNIFKPSVLGGIDALGLMMIAIMILVFGPLATVKPADVASLAVPLLITFGAGIAGIAVFAIVTGRLVGYSVSMSLAIGLTSLFGFPGTMILSQEAARGAGDSPEEVAAIEGQILPKMIVAGFSTVTITSVILTGIIVGHIGRG
jgi:hypothetical protein